MAVGMKELIFLAFMLVLGVLTTIFACTLVQPHNAWPLVPLLCYLFAPVPAFLCSSSSSSESAAFMGDNSSSTFENFSHFLIGVTVASGPSIAIMLYHVGAIADGQLFLSLGSGSLFGIGVAYVIYKSNERPADSLGF
jgi:hypothetical protein